MRQGSSAASARKVALVTGASRGIGAACAHALAASGHRVYGTSRRPLPGRGPVKLLAMDVNETASVNAVISAILAEEARIDIVVNNAGFGYGGAVEDTRIAEAKALFETNVFGVLRVCRAVLPTMRAQRSGLIVNVSSLGGRIGLPFQGVYSASKFALEGMTEALRMEIAPFGLYAVLLEPGDTRTDFTSRRRATREVQERETYRTAYTCALAHIEEDELHGASPEMVARTLMRIVNSPAPRLRYVSGTLVEKLALWLKPRLPAALFQKLLMKNYGL